MVEGGQLLAEAAEGGTWGRDAFPAVGTIIALPRECWRGRMTGILHVCILLAQGIIHATSDVPGFFVWSSQMPAASSTASDC